MPLSTCAAAGKLAQESCWFVALFALSATSSWTGKLEAQHLPEVSAPRAIPSRGFYDRPLTVALSSSTSGTAIFYTMDGSEPSKRNGTRYTREILISGSPDKAVTTLRAAAFRDGFKASKSVTWTYVFADQVPLQPPDPDGFPKKWPNHPAADYAMDPAIASSSDDKGKLKQGLLGLPSVSVVLDVDDLFGPQGIYSNSLSHGAAWERAASAELIYPDARQGFQVNCGVRIIGGASRQPEKSPKHSFRLIFRDQYGPRKLKFSVFPGSSVISFDNLVLRAETNNSWLHQHEAQRISAQYIRDQWVRESQAAMGHLSGRGILVHCYLNGLYWGLYNLTERPDASFLAEHLGGDKEDYDALNSGEAIDGDRTAWEKAMAIANAGLKTLKQYEAIQAYVDLTNLADYMLLNFYAGTRDWPFHNWYVGRERKKGAQFKFIVWDAERGIEDPKVDRTGVDDPDTPALLYARLRENEEFRLLFADRVQKHLFGDGALTREAAESRWIRLSDQVARAVVAESARWGDYRRDVHPFQVGPYYLYTRKTHWLAESKRLLKQFFPPRTSLLLEQLRKQGLYPPVNAPSLRPEGDDRTLRSIRFEVTTSSKATIYFTTNGSDPRAYGSGAIGDSARVYLGPVTLEGPTVIKARTLTGGSWSALSEGTFLASNAAPAILVSEIMYNPPGEKGNEFIELWNPGRTAADLGGLKFKDGVEFTFAAGTLLRAGGFLVLASNADDFKQSYPEVRLGGVFQGNLDNAGEKISLVDGTNRELFSVSYDNGAFWPLGPDGHGFSLVLADPAGDPDKPQSWGASANVHGSPGAVDPPQHSGGVVINEVLTKSGEPLEDAIELLNPTSEAIPIGGWFLSDDRDSESALKKFKIPVGIVLPSSGYAVFYENQFNSNPGSPSSFKLDGGGGAVYLAATDSRGRLTGHVTGYKFQAAENGIPFGLVTTTRGLDFTALSAPTFGADSAKTKAEFRLGKGGANAQPRVGSVVINEIHYHPLEGDDQFVELLNLTSLDIELHDGTSQLGWRLHGVKNVEGSGDFEFPAGTVIPSHGFLVLCGIDPAEFRRRHKVPADAPIAGPFAGGLDDSGERLELLRPAPAPNPKAQFIEIDHLRHDDKAPWALDPDGSGPSLERTSAHKFGNDAANWKASAARGGTPGATNSTSAPTVNSPPVASFTIEPASGQAPLLVTFDASESSDSDGKVLEYAWDFGDGMPGEGAVATHLYASSGDFQVKLRVTDNQGNTAVETGEVRVAPSPSDDPGGDKPPADESLGSSTTSFTALRDLLSRFPRAVLPPDPHRKNRSIQLAGGAWILSGTAKHKFRGARTTATEGQFVLAFGPIQLKGDDGEPLVSLPGGWFLLIDAENRRFLGTYTDVGRGKAGMGPNSNSVHSYLGDFVADHPPTVPFELERLEVSKLAVSAKARAGRTADTFNLKLKASLVLSGRVNGRPGPVKGTYSFKGTGKGLR